jgi:hypothetical protein
MTELLHGLAPITRFPTVDEMASWAAELPERFPGRVTVRDVGNSRNGDAIQLVSIVPAVSGSASAPLGRALITGQPHPNEPIGMATIMAMCEALLSNGEALEATGVEWHFVPDADPDGTRLNEGWFDGPWTREHYARNFYRPAGDLQVEWTFPFSSGDFAIDKPMPETIALMAAIDFVQPTVGASLHNGEMGGAYFYASEGAPDAYYQRLGELCLEHSVPLHLGDPEAPFSAVLAPAVFSIPATQQIYDYVSAAGGDPADVISGGSSIEYMMRHNAVFGVVVELPYWRDDRSADTSPDPSGKTLREVVLAGLDLEEAMVSRLQALYEQASPLEPSPFQEAINSFVMEQGTSYIDVQRHQANHNPEGDRPATVADVFSIMDNVHMSRLRMGGMFLRALADDSSVKVDAEAIFAQWCAEEAADSQAQSITINDLVAIQAEAILATIAYSVGRYS